ncbi:MAG: hypothetical protein LBI06_04325, partial [Treponema sp.]|nr:hypothetical protein [Treponema sp.]
MRRILKCLIFAVFLPTFAYAGGGREIVTHTADGLDIWQTEFDVSGKRPGTYNVIISAKDAAGNEGISGPYNIKVDPMAGLPEARVVFPDHGQVIRNDINIIGVASGRYGLKQILVKIDNGDYIVLDGGEYWSHFIPAMDLAEGRHTISVKAIDDHNLSGPEAKISFILDIDPPLIELLDREVGDIIAGNVKINGRVSDANGIQSLSISSDGENFTPLRLSRKRGDDARYFQFPIRTKRYEDGALVYYVRAVNTTGSSTTRPFLFFVNNFAPVIEILAPLPGEDAYGDTQVTGRVLTGIGLTEFYFEWAGERVNIPLHIGDPFWTVTFPISMAHNRAVPFRITAVDRAGNVSTLTQRIQDARRNKTPALEILFPPMPAAGRINLEADQPIYGRILPGFFPYAVMIEGEIEYILAQPVFRIDPGLIPEGRTDMRLWGIDEDDVTGDPFVLRVSKSARTGPAPAESPLTIESPEMYDWFGDSVTVRGSIDNHAGQSLEYRLRWDDAWKPVRVDAGGAFAAVISLAGLPEGAVPMEFRTVRSGRGDYPLFFPVNKFITKPEITFLFPDKKFGS